MTVEGICTCMHLLHTPSLSDTHYQPTSSKCDYTRTYQAKKHASTALIQEASKMHSRNIIESHPCFGFLGMRSHHQWWECLDIVLMSLARKGIWQHTHTHNTRTASINLLSISSRQHVHANDCNAVIITTIIRACKRIVQTTALQGGKGESFSAVDFTRFGSEMVIYWAANGIGVLAVLDQIGIWGKSILPPSAHAVEQQDIIRSIFVNIFLLYTSRTKLTT